MLTAVAVVHYLHMRKLVSRLLLAVALLSSNLAFASAYDARPKLIVILVVDQFRPDFLERNRSSFGRDGFALFIDRGAYFADCRYAYAATHTGPGYATLLTGAYVDGHGILGNGWWDPERKRHVLAENDDSTHLLGVTEKKPGGSPHFLLASTLGDELKLATQGRARVFSVSLKPRAAILQGGHAADAAYWISRSDGAWLSSSFYMDLLPGWVEDFNRGGRAAKYWDLEWKDASGTVLTTTRPRAKGEFYQIVGGTPYGTDYQLEFTRELITQEKLGTGPATDLLIIGLSANDILGHDVAHDSPRMSAMIQRLDRQLAEFFRFLGRQIGLANVWMVLSADHGISPLPENANKLRLPGEHFDAGKLRRQLNTQLSERLSPGKPQDYIGSLDWPVAYLSADAFTAAGMKQADAERAVGELLVKTGRWRSFYTRLQIESGQLPPDSMSQRYAHSTSPRGGWHVLGVPALYDVAQTEGTDHHTPYAYDTHVPLAFYGLPFRPGRYYTAAEPVDIVTTLSVLLGIPMPSHSIGRVLNEALAAPADTSPGMESR
ncbi:MAG: alkaline phosphatase family protein [Acidobacteria bacterium]|nr:alkaline phosphatase family protein [Acidobacteriota bacterium]